MSKYKSYKQGGYDTETILGVIEKHQFENNGITDDDTEFDLIEYMRGQISALIEAVHYLNNKIDNISDTANRAANTASCLANGIQPD